MNDSLRLAKKGFTLAVVGATILWSVGLAAFVNPMTVRAAVTAGENVRGTTLSTVYYIGSDGSRYIYPNAKTYFSWYADFSGVRVISDSELASIPLASANIVYRSGSRFVKVLGDDPKTYAVTRSGSLRWIESEEVAKGFAGNDWNMFIDDVPVAFFGNYTVGASLMSAASAYEGALVKSGSDYYLVWDGKKRMVTSAGLSANRFNTGFALDGTGVNLTSMTAGSDVVAAESALTATNQSSAAPVGAGLSVSLAANNPASSTVVAGQAIADLAHYTFTNSSSSEVKVNKVILKRLGISSDSTLSAVYLYDGVVRVTDSATVSSGYITFNDSSGLFAVPANSSRTISVRSNIAAATSGQTLGVGVQAATDVVLSTNGSVSGTFPMNANLHTVAAATLSTVSFATTTTPAAASVDPQNDFVVWENNVTVSNTKAILSSVRFRQIGSINNADIKNFRFFVDGVQKGSAVANLTSDGYVTFDLSAAPVTMNTGTRVFKLMADVIGGTSRNVQMSLRNTGDVYVVDFDYNQPVLVQANSTTFTSRDAGLQTINTGTLTISRMSTSPSGNVTNAASAQTLARFELRAFGEKMKVEALRFNVSDDDSDTAYRLRNGSIFANGVQVGTTTGICGDDTTTASACTSVAGSNASYTEFTFGSSLVVEPATPVTLEVKADVFDNDGTNGITAADTIQLVVDGGASINNVLRMTTNSYASVPTADVTANTLTVSEGSLAIAIDQSYGAQTTVVPQTAYKMGAWSLTTGSVEAVTLNTFTLTNAVADAFAVADATNLYMKYGTKTTSVTASGAASMSWSVSESMAKNASMSMQLYADMSAAATNGDATGDTWITTLTVAGTTADSATSVTTSAVAGQTITATSSGNLTIQLDSTGNPQAAQVVSGDTPSNGSFRFKVTAANEDLYVKDLTFRVDAQADDAALSSIALFAGTTTLSQVSISKSWSNDGSTNPGFVTWNLTGSDRILVPKNGTIYIMVKPTYVSSGQTAVTGTTPAISLSTLVGEGSAGQVAATDTDGSDLVVESGLLVGGATPTFAADGTATSYTALGTTQTMTANAAPTTSRTGQFVLIDVNADATYDNATDEIGYVMEGGTGDATLLIQRAALGTTQRDDAAGNIYFLAGINGNAMTVLNTKLSLALASDSPSGATTGGSAKVIFKFNAAAANNASDPAENIATITVFDLTTTKSASSVRNVLVYPSEFDNNATYVTTCVGLSTTQWRCTLSSTGNTNQVIENTSRTFVVRGDVGYSGAGSVEVSIGTLGSSDTSTNDVTWSDGTTSIVWVNQSTSVVQGGAQTTTAASGSADATAPTISTTAGSFLFGEGSTTTANTLDADDLITITFTEMIDPTTVAATLVPGGSAVTITDGATGDLVLSSAGLVTVTNIATTDVDGGSATASTYTNTAALNSAGTVLTLQITVTSSGALSAGEVFGDVTGLTTTITDINGNLLADSAINASGAI